MRILLLVLIAFIAQSKSIIVGKNNITSIKGAIQNSQSGDTIYIPKGIYKEGNIIIKNPLTLIGLGYPQLDGENKHEIITVIANHVTIQGISFLKTGVANIEDIAAVKAIQADYINIVDNKFIDTYFAIHISNTSYPTVSNNVIFCSNKNENQTGNGIHLWKSENATIKNNSIRGHRDGIYFEFVTHSTVSGNLSFQNFRYGLHFMFSHENSYTNNTFRNNGSGVAVMYTKNVTMIANRFEDNWGPSSYGLLLKDISNSRVEENFFTANSIAVVMEGCSRTVFTKNEFSKNGWALKVQANCDENSFLENLFLSNTFDITTNGSLSLNTLTRNYWDKYEGYDLDKDGIGDIPFRPVSLYGMVVEKMPTAVMLWRSFLVTLLDKAEKVIPMVTPENLKDNFPLMKNPRKLLSR